MNSSDLAEYLDHDPFLEPQQPQPKPAEVIPVKPKRSAETERDQHESDVLRLVMDIFTGARWTTRQEYTRAAALRDRKGRKTRE